jgi:hypothetical protein
VKPTTTRFDIGRLKSEPESFVELPARTFYSIPREELGDIQLSAARLRFDTLKGRVAMLGRFAQEQGVEEIRDISDLALLLVPHSAYKSYPLSYLENGQFDRMTRWLGSFTTSNLSRIDTGACECIDDWIIALDRQTDVRITHSTGTSGKLSFLPRSEHEWARVQAMMMLRLFEGYGEERGAEVIEDFTTLPYIYPGYRYGAMGHPRAAEMFEKYWHRGNGTPIVTLHPGRLSADALSLGGRLAAAESRGELGRLEISPKLLARRQEFLDDHAHASERFDAFMDAITRFKGQRIFMAALHTQFWDMAVEGAKRGLTHLFAPDSLFLCSGGMKGRVIPEDWENHVTRFLGGRLREGYGMIEGMGGGPRCAHGYYHIQPWLILFLLDPKSGVLLPRSGMQTGRLGIFDLAAWTYWGGFLSGDRVTIHWGDDRPCRCGRLGPYVDPDIRRYSEIEGGDDKITCAGAPEAHDRALDFILQHIA